MTMMKEIQQHLLNLIMMADHLRPSGEEIAMTSMNRGQEKASKIAETSFIEGDTTY